jgi:hypothetical protein
MEHFRGKCTKDTAAELLLQSWDELPKSVATAGWDFGDPRSKLMETAILRMKDFALIWPARVTMRTFAIRGGMPEAYDEEEEDKE